jgi:hypothetical protein
MGDVKPLPYYRRTRTALPFSKWAAAVVGPDAGRH